MFFLNGRPLEAVRDTLAEVRRLPRGLPMPLRFTMSAFVIARPTDAEAQEAFQHLSALVALDDRSALLRGVDDEVIMFKNMAKYPGLGSNGGTAEGLVGIYDTVATRIADGEVVGGLATSWEVTDNALTYTFHLHETVEWWDGKDLTAEDGAFSGNRVIELGTLDPASGCCGPMFSLQ